MKCLFGGAYLNKKVLITGHTGFKGSWLAMWLMKMGAIVIGYSLPPKSEPNHFELLKLKITSITGDIRDNLFLEDIFLQHRPDVVFHMAAQPLVLHSYEKPFETFETNVMGTIRVLEACRRTDSVKVIINVTSDKCYDNKEWVWGYRENDAIGGYDPYSASKGCAEIVTSSYRSSFFNLNDYKHTHNILLASCRAGNVIGGGDWSDDRLIPDIMRATANGSKVIIRNPHAVRPWQHVLESLSGYLMIGQKLLEEKKEFADGWNFGPGDDSSIAVKDVIASISKYWSNIEADFEASKKSLHEANYLKLDCSKANSLLEWKNVWNAEQAFEKTSSWYKGFYQQGILLSDTHLREYISDAEEKNIPWVSLSKVIL